MSYQETEKGISFHAKALSMESVYCRRMGALSTELTKSSHLPQLALMAAPFQEWTIKLGNLFWEIHHFVIDKDVHSLPSRLAADRMQN